MCNSQIMGMQNNNMFERVQDHHHGKKRKRHNKCLRGFSVLPFSSSGGFLDIASFDSEDLGIVEITLHASFQDRLRQVHRDQRIRDFSHTFLAH